MISGLYSAASAMEASNRQHDLISQNLAHAQMPGYRRQTLVGDTMESTFDDSMKSAVNFQAFGTHSQQIITDFTPGMMEKTGHPLDIALQGEGFFVVQGPSGPLYTRNGVFQLDAQGKLVTSDLLPVAGRNGDIQLPPGTSLGNVLVNEDGRIFVGNIEVDQIRVVTFSDTQQLTQAGATLYEAPDDIPPQDHDGQLLQGSRERSNVSPIQEMIELIANQRRHEAAQRTLAAMSDSLGKHINHQGGV
jgi:flagellar basal-body rod protein FlgF